MRPVRTGVCADASELVNDMLRSLREQQHQSIEVTPEIEAWLLEGGGNTNLVKLGTGALNFTGTSTHGGQMAVMNGALLVNGSLGGSVHVERNGSGTIATLGGTGTVGNVTATGVGARIAPGATTNVPSYGKLTVNQVTLGAGASYQCQLGGTNVGVNLDQIDAASTVTLGGGFADFTAFGAGVTSNRYAVVKSAVPVSGSFSGLSEGGTLFPAAGRIMTITYLTAAGKEITLIEQPGADLTDIQITGITAAPNGAVTIMGEGNPGSNYFVEGTTNLAPANWITLGSVIGAFDGGISFTDTNAPFFPQRFYRFRLE